MNAANEKDEGGFSALPDYLHRAILLRLPAQCVVKTAAVSRQWKALAIERLVEHLAVSNEAAVLDAAWLKHGLPKAASPERVDSPPGPAPAREIEDLLRMSRELGADAAEDNVEIAQRLKLMVAENKELVPLWRLGWRPNWPLPKLRRDDSGDGEAAMSGIFLHEQRLPSHPRDVVIVMRNGIFDADLRVVLVVLLAPTSPPTGTKSRNRSSSGPGSCGINHHASEWHVVKAIAPHDSRHCEEDLVRFLTEIASANSARQLLLSRCRSCPAAKQPGSSSSHALRVERAIAALGLEACIYMPSEDLLSWSPSRSLPRPASFLLVKFPFRRTRKTSGRAIEKALPMARAAAKLLLHNPKMTLLLRPLCAAEAAFNRDSLGSVMDRRISLLQQDCLL